MIKFTDHKYIEVYINSNWLYFVHDDLVNLTIFKYLINKYEISNDNYLQHYFLYRNGQQPHHLTLK